jgi:hypothetical protein
MLRAGVVAVVATAGTLAGTAAPALAAPPTVTIEQLNTNLNAGQSTRLQYTVRNDVIGNGGPQAQVQIRVNISSNGLSCSGDCGSVETIGNEERFSATLRASNNLAPGSTQTVTVSISAQNSDGPGQPATAQVTLRGPDAPESVASVSGKVTNADTGRGISGALVALQDDGGHSYNTQTNDDGEFKFTSSNNRPISPGQIDLAAGKEGFKNTTTSTNANAGQAKSGVRLTLKSTASPSASASASPTEDEPTEEPTDDVTSDASIDPAAAGNNSDSGGGGLFSWVLIILGGLLVALGVGAIVLLVIRRKEGGDGEDGADDPNPDPHGPMPTPGAQGVYRGGADPTMVTGGAAMGGANPTMPMNPALANAPTMMHQPVDEYGDPYGTPLRAPQPGGPAPHDPYSPRPESPAYGAQGGGYGYDEPTGRYTPNDGYGPPAGGGYGPSAGNGYDDGYGAHRQGNGYDPGPPPAPRDEYGYGQQQPQGGYDEYGGYEQPQPPPPPRGYDQGYYDEPPPSRDRPSPRRSLDWLDD